MVVKKQITARINLNLLNEYVDSYQKFHDLKFKGDLPKKDLTVTQLLEESLFYAKKYLDEKIRKEK